MSYALLRGVFVIRYPDLPRQGPEPDGDTVKFKPDSPALVETLPRVSGRAPDINARGISVRLEAIDTLETHFSETHNAASVHLDLQWHQGEPHLRLLATCPDTADYGRGRDRGR